MAQHPYTSIGNRMIEQKFKELYGKIKDVTIFGVEIDPENIKHMTVAAFLFGSTSPDMCPYELDQKVNGGARYKIEEITNSRGDLS